MSQSENSLLLRIRGDSSGGKAAIAETRAAVAQLRQSFGPELTQTVTVANKAFSQISDNLNVFVGQRIPLVGGAFVRVTENLRNFSSESGKSEKAITAVSKSIQSIATESNKTVPQITSFLTKFVQLEGQANRDKAAIDFFGASLGARLIPQLEETGAALGEVAGESAAAGTSIGAMAGPIGIAVVAIAALAAGAVVAAREIFDLAKTAADFQGKLFDLSQQTGVSVETLSALEVVARTTGSSIENLAQSLGIFQKKLEEAVEDSGSKAAITFRKLGVDATDTESALRQTVAALARMPEGFRQTALALEVFGRGGKAFLAIAKESNGDIDQIIEKLRSLGLVTTQQAKLADEFNDQLVLLEVQLRGLGAQAIPVVLDLLKDLSKFLADNRILFIELQGAVKGLALAIAGPVKLGFVAFKAQLEAVAFLTERIKAAIEFIVGHPIPNPFAGSVPAASPEEPRKQLSPEDSAAQTFKKNVEEEIASRRKLQGVLNFDFQQRRDLAENNIALAQREFEAGKITREQLLQAVLVNNRKKTQADLDQLKVERDLKLREIALAKDDVEKQTQISNAILAIDTQMSGKRAELQRTQKDLTAKSQLEERKDLLAHEERQLELLSKFNEQRIAVIESGIRAGVTERQKGLQEIEEIENKALVLRGQLLKRELELAGVGPDRQTVLDKIKALETERTELERAQSERRIQISQEEVAARNEAFLAGAETSLRIAGITDSSRIASLKAAAAIRIRTEEETEKAILQIRLAAIDREDDLARIQNTAAKAQIEARLNAIQEARRTLESQLTAASAIEDPTNRVAEQNRITKALKENVDQEISAQGQANKDRDRLDKELNDQLRVNNAERQVIQSQGERDIEEGRQKDLTNERRYADDLEEIKGRISDTERDTADDVIRLMRLHFARRRDIIAAQRDLDLADEEARHQRESRKIKRQQDEVDEEIRILESHLKSLTIGTTEEIEQYERIIEELEKLRVKRSELQAQQEVEDKRSTTRKRRVTDESTIDLESEEPLSTRTLLGDAFAENFAKFRAEAEATQESVNNLAVAFSAAAQTAADFFEAQSEAAGNFATIAGGAIQTFTEGLNQMISAWVLTGETGPSALRKLTAQVLAQVAAQAAVKAIFELAEGFAMLFVNPAAAAAHFTAAAIYGSVAGVAAVAGRSIAGDLFKPKQGADSGTSRSSPQGLQTITQDRNRQQAQTLRLVIEHRVNDSEFGRAITSHVVRDIGDGGQIREVLATDGRAR